MPDPNLDPLRQPPSLWAAVSEPAPPTDPLPPGEHVADLAIIGGGFGGLAAALHAARRGLRTILLEAAEIGWGAAGRNNGQIVPNLKVDPDALLAEFGPEHGATLVALLRDSADLVFALIREHGIDCEAVQNGWLQPAHRASRLAVARARVEQWRRHGAPVDFVDRERMAELTGSPIWHGGWLNASGGHLNPLAFARGLACAALAAGAMLHTRSPVRTLERRGEHWRLGLDGAVVSARRVIVATQGYTDFFSEQLWPQLGRSIVAARSYQLATEPLPPELRATILPHNHTFSDTHNDLHFAHFDRAGRLVTGGALIFSFDFERRLRRSIGERLLKLFPQLAPLGLPRFESVWHGDFSATVDRMPRFHRVDDSLYTWIGCNGRGVGLACALGPRLVDAALGDDVALPFEAPRPIPAHALVSRFALSALAYYRWLDGRD